MAPALTNDEQRQRFIALVDALCPGQVALHSDIVTHAELHELTNEQLARLAFYVLPSGVLRWSTHTTWLEMVWDHKNYFTNRALDDIDDVTYIPHDVTSYLLAIVREPNARTRDMLWASTIDLLKEAGARCNGADLSDAPLSDLQAAKQAGGHTKHRHSNGRQYMVRTGPRGGRHIIVKGKKVYIEPK